MPKMVQIRNVPDDLHRAIKQRALDEGTSMSELLLRWAERELARPSRAEVLARWAAREPTGEAIDWAAIIREGREEQDAKWS
jgi:antitoxin FitA